MKRARPAGGSEIEEILREVRAIYDELARIPIERDCVGRAECCRFKLTGRTPFLTKAEALFAAKALRRSGRTRAADAPDGACPLLDGATSKCLVYEGRPFGCRTHFCSAAGGPYPRAAVAGLIHRLEDSSRKLGSQDAQPLPAALKAALLEL